VSAPGRRVNLVRSSNQAGRVPQVRARSLGANLGVTYTAGNPVNDGVHSYTWDANWGTVASIDTTSVTHDALGRIVEQQNGATSTQVMYGPTGKVALMAGGPPLRFLQRWGPITPTP
jgi:hypothetical protein